MQIIQPRKIEESSKGFLGDLGAIAKIAAAIPGPQQPYAIAASVASDLTAHPGSVEQAAGVQTQGQGGGSGAMARRLMESQPMQLAQALQENPEFEALRRRLTYG